MNFMKHARHVRRLMAVAMLPIGLGGCASMFADEGFSDVTAVAEKNIGKRPVWIKDEKDRAAANNRVTALLAEPLTADTAIEVALLNNRGVQASLAELGIAAADLAAASRPPNPGFTYSRAHRGGDIEIDRTLTGNILGILTTPITFMIEQRRFEQATWRASSDVLRFAFETKRAWYRAVAAQQIADYVAQTKDAAETQAVLAQRMAAVGNFPRLDYAREQIFYAETAAQLAHARLAATAAREKLARMLGLWGQSLAFKLPPRLPDLPAKPTEASDIEPTAIASRLDIRMAKAEIDGLSTSLGLAQATRFINVLEASYLRNTESNEPKQTGFEVHVEIPLFDFGAARVAKAEAIYMQAVNRLAEIAINARSEVRTAYAGYRTSYDLAKHYRDEIIPVRQGISEELLLRYNGMLISVFELLSNARDQIADVTAAIGAQRDFWLSDSELQAAMILGLDGAQSVSQPLAGRSPASAGGH